MADRNTSQHNNTTRPPRPTPTATTTTNPLCASHANASAFLRRLHENSPNSTQLMSVITLVVSGGILLILTGLTLTAIISGFIFLAPLILLSVPLWFPIIAVFFVSITGFLSFCGFGVTAVAALSWLYRYFRGLHPPGSDRFDYARSRLATTAREVKDYAREYGGYLHSKVKDAAPGA